MSVKTAYVAVNLEQHKGEILARWRNAARQESAQSKERRCCRAGGLSSSEKLSIAAIEPHQTVQVCYVLLTEGRHGLCQTGLGGVCNSIVRSCFRREPTPGRHGVSA